ncbi:hypothetical protein HAX54_042059, partial [Datura stramonium]|nr:hypothetical protein [Datura stramonium]
LKKRLREEECKPTGNLLSASVHTNFCYSPTYHDSGPILGREQQLRLMLFVTRIGINEALHNVSTSKPEVVLVFNVVFFKKGTDSN